MIGRILAHDRITAAIGEGGMGHFDPLRADPRFAALPWRLGLPSDVNID